MIHEDADATSQLATELVMYASRLIRAVRRNVADEPAPASVRLLAQIEERGPVGITALAQWENTAQPTMSAAVRQLAEKGWVARQADPNDARASLISLTATGADELRRARARYGDIVAEWFASAGDYSVDDLRRAADLVKSLVAQGAPRPDATSSPE